MIIQEVGCNDINECLFNEAEAYCGNYSSCFDVDGWADSTSFNCQCLSGFESWSSYTGR